MNGIGKLGVFLTFVGFLIVGSAVLYPVNSGAESLQDVTQVAKNAATAQGAGWIVAGMGLAMALFGLGRDMHDLATVVPDISGLPRSPLGLRAREGAKTNPDFVCSDCGGDISVDAKACSHCGSPIEGE